jgi:hypothetical protein
VIATVIASVNYVEDTPTSQVFFTLRLCKFCLSTPLKIVEPSNSLVFDVLNVSPCQHKEGMSQIFCILS